MNWIGGYEQLTAMRTAGSGSARWCIARRQGQRFFVKEFLSPVYPLQTTPSALTEKQKKRCEVFEEQKQRLYAALSCVIGDTVVPVLDFFRHEGRYYAISEEVPRPYLEAEAVSGLSRREMRGILYSLAECLQRLHAQGIVHADLKPEHVLLIGEKGRYEPKLIDLDSGFLEEEPPEGERDLEGDPVYLAPEAFLKLSGEDVTLTCKMDSFALGILIHRLWTGELPIIQSPGFSYLYEAALAGGEIRLSSALPLAYRFPVQQMLRKDPGDRPSDEEIVNLLSPPRSEILKGEAEDAALNGLSRFMKKK